MTRIDRLPEGLGYLQRFATALGRRSPESLNEDLDPEPLIRAVRKRFESEDRETARGAFRGDVETLEAWLQEEGRAEHPAHWILGFLAGVELDELLDEPPPLPAGPTIEIDLPAGWKGKSAPGSFTLTRGRVFASLFVITPESAALFAAQLTAPPPDLDATVRAVQERMFRAQGLEVTLPPMPRREETRSVTEVVFGPVTGKKFEYRMLRPTPMRQVNYLLAVSGGEVRIQVGHTKLGKFDETLLEGAFASLRLIPTRDSAEGVRPIVIPQFSPGTRVLISADYWDRDLAGRTGTIAPYPEGLHRNQNTCWVELDFIELHPGDTDAAEVSVESLSVIPE